MGSREAEVLKTLRRVPLFNELSEAELEALAARTASKSYESGTIVFSEGDLCRELLIVEAGSVRLYKSARNGREQLIAIERAGNTLAEVPAFDGGRYSVTARAQDSVCLLILDADIFRRVCLQNPQVAVKLIKVLGHRLRHLDGLVEELSFSTVRGRLVAHLSHLAREQGRKRGDCVEFELKENNEELAARLGTVRELISRNLGRLHGDGLIEMRRRTVRIPNLDTLEREIDSNTQR
jgi:CRP/FNR family transcriptional regulator